ncbi:MAG: family 1 glycosylhydrolase, partial [Bacteroidota bacterium]
GRPTIVMTENGCSSDDHPVKGVVDDPDRVSFYRDYLTECHKAIENGVKLEGYFAWSFFDNFEWASGYRPRFGLNYVDYETFERIPKSSALWFKKVREDNGF